MFGLTKKASYLFQEESMSKLLRRDSLMCLLLPAILAICVGSFAQSTRGSLAGNVTDTSGAVIAGAKIVAVGIDTGVTNQTVTTSSGVYHFRNSPSDATT